jgi:RNase_H superfamily
MNTLYLDIETSPYLVETFPIRNIASIRPDQVVRHSELLCFAAKWRGAKRTEFRSTYHDGKEAMVRRAWELLDQADVVVHYYGSRFDIPRLNQEFLLAGLPPPSPYQQVDLYRTVRRFNFGSGKLGAVLDRLGLTAKVKHQGQSLWTACLAGDPKAWRLMKAYCVGDVIPLEELHNVLMPWLVSPPNLALFTDDGKLRCARCGSTNVQRRGFAHRRSAKYQQWRCNDCQGWSTETTRTSGTTTVPEAA